MVGWCKLMWTACVFLFLFSQIEGQRLIQFSETNKAWLNQSEVDRLVFSAGVHTFMDVTDYDNVYNSIPVKADATPIPTAPSHTAYVKSLLPEADVKNVVESITELSDFYTRYYTSPTGIQAGHWVQQRFSQLALAGEAVSVVNFTNTFPQISVIATIPGTGPNKDSVVIIGAHLDSVGSSATGRSPGADDDGTGIASIFEIFRVLVEANYQPDYTLKFMAYAAEEVGLLGSQAIATSYAKDNVDVYAVLQLDMTGYNKNAIGIITDQTSSELNAFVRTLVETYTTLNWRNSVCGYGCSDHASWTRIGARASFPFETPFGSHNPNIHSTRDTLEHLSLEQMLQFVYLGIGFAVELAGVASS